MRPTGKSHGEKAAVLAWAETRSRAKHWGNEGVAQGCFYAGVIIDEEQVGAQGGGVHHHIPKVCM